ncbi:hypothetical protein ASE82_01350 [Sphingomonas sp. Leaf230]|nr:hypothetical protein ASE82_01350 [Sphingomonas sp. Leaf230]
MGSGWTSGHVAVDEYHSFPSTRDQNGKPLHICLTQDAQNFSEFSREIDILIQELEAVRLIGKRKFEKLG